MKCAPGTPAHRLLVQLLRHALPRRIARFPPDRSARSPSPNLRISMPRDLPNSMELHHLGEACFPSSRCGVTGYCRSVRLKLERPEGTEKKSKVHAVGPPHQPDGNIACPLR